MTDRGWFTLGLFGLTVGMLVMAVNDPALWEAKLFEVILQAVVITGLLNMAGAFHFAATKQNEKATENTGEAFKAIRAAQQSSPSPSDHDAIHPGDTVTLDKPETER